MKKSLLYVTYYLAFLFTNGMEIDEKCNFLDTKLQPNTFRLLSRTIVPELGGKMKGDSGKIGVIGGSIEYTGAPYFSAITALKVCKSINKH